MKIPSPVQNYRAACDATRRYRKTFRLGYVEDDNVYVTPAVKRRIDAGLVRLHAWAQRHADTARAGWSS